ncbi:MAG TPA: ATP-binding protein [Acidobacteriaceae bacterium]|jgi:signal transduction histidine kinase|nr:ATP-binding protein [Acidobacteriaceae bacterium]
MRLKTKLVLAITGLVFGVVVIFSWIWMSQLLQQHIDQSYLATDFMAHQISREVSRALDTGLSGRRFDPRDRAAVRAAVEQTLRQDAGLNDLLNSIEEYSPTVLDIAIADRDGRALVAVPEVALDDQPLPVRPDYADLRRTSVKSMIRTLKIVFGPPQVYNDSLGLDLNNQPFLTIRIGIRTTFLRNAFHPWLMESLSFIGLAMVISLVVAAFVANLALQPIEQISRRLDALAAQEALAEEPAAGAIQPANAAGEPGGALAALTDPLLGRGDDAVAEVSGKIERLGQRIRNVEEVFSALRENLDQILSNLQDGMMLFTRESRAVLVSSSVERFLNMSRDRMFGAEVREIFDRSTRLGRTVRDAFEGGMSIVQEEVTTETGRRVEVSLDFIHDSHARDRHALGALLTLHDLESVREIESELEVSRRMAAIGRLTAGVGHEVKNPINAIVVHLELLRNKVNSGEDAMRHLDVIQSEIRRLDRVVQTLVDFSRPVELQLKDQDLRDVAASVLMLASAELETRGITVESRMPGHAVMCRGDSDLLKQALLNIVLNGAQAMAGGGALEVELSDGARWATLQVRDHGTGIPDEIRPRIFDLYFTTKKEGSGIGLAMTYRIVQMHHGQIDVESKPGSGTTFVLRLPLTSAGSGQRVAPVVPDHAIAGELARQGEETQPERSGP